MTTTKTLNGKSYAGNPRVRFDEGAGAPSATPRRGSLLCKRREFIGGVMAVGASPLFGVDGGDGRIARIGLITDTHVGPTLGSCSRVRAAFTLFKSKGVEMVINCGDIADRHYPQGYRFYRQTVNEVYPEPASRPKEVFVYAWHDLIDHKKALGKWDPVAAYDNVRKLLEAPNPPFCDFTWKGLPFVVATQNVGTKGFPSWEDYEKTVERVCAANPGKPVFVCDHLPPAGTTFHSREWGSDKCRLLLNRFPQVVSLSGHVHGTLANERQIWQGEFTAVNIGCLNTWGGFASGSTPPRQAKPNFGAIVMDVFADRLVLHRHDVRDGSETDQPWIVPLPFSPSSAPYVPARAAARVKRLPAFNAGAKVAVTPEGEDFKVQFDDATTPQAFMYRIQCERKNARGEWESFSQDDVFSEFWKAKADRTGTISHVLASGFFSPRGTYRVAVRPLDFFYRAGAAIASDEAVMPETPAMKELWKIEPPAQGLRFTEYKEPVERTVGGRFVPSTGQGTLWLPENAFANLARGKRHQLVLDLDSCLPDGDWCGWRVHLVSSSGRRVEASGALTASGAPGTRRYVFTFTPPEDGSFPASCNLTFNNHLPGASLRIDGVRLIRG